MKGISDDLWRKSEKEESEGIISVTEERILLLNMKKSFPNSRKSVWYIFWLVWRISVMRNSYPTISTIP